MAVFECVVEIESLNILFVEFSQYFSLLFCQFGTHDVVVLRPNKADLGSPALGQGVVYRLKVILTMKCKVGHMRFWSL